MPGFGSPAVGTSGAEEAAGAEGVVASNRPVAVTWAEGDGRIVAAFGFVGAGAIATASGVMISGGPRAVGLTGEGGGGTFCEGPRGACRGAVWGTIEPTTVGFLRQQLRHPGVPVDCLLNGSAHLGIRWHRRLGA